MSKSIQEQNFLLFNTLMARSQIEPNSGWKACKLTAPCYMALHMDNLGRAITGQYYFAIAHNGEQNGDVMADPDMEIEYNDRLGTLHANHYQNDYAGVFDRRDCLGPSAQRDMDKFLNTWLQNLLAQGHALNG